MKNADMCAFPADSKTQTNGGLTKREYFAVMAMQGMFSQHNFILKDLNELTIIAVRCADALLYELDKAKPE